MGWRAGAHVPGEADGPSARGWRGHLGSPSVLRRAPGLLRGEGVSLVVGGAECARPGPWRGSWGRWEPAGPACGSHLPTVNGSVQPGPGAVRGEHGGTHQGWRVGRGRAPRRPWLTATSALAGGTGQPGGEMASRLEHSPSAARYTGRMGTPQVGAAIWTDSKRAAKVSRSHPSPMAASSAAHSAPSANGAPASHSSGAAA